MYKEWFSALAIILTFAIFVPYIRSILRGHTKPHVFSWTIWGLGTFIVFFAQLADDGGVGAWPIGISAGITCGIATLAYLKRGDTSITRADWVLFATALSTLPFWFFTNDPLWAVVILTVTDLVGFGPTLRRAYAHPFDERVSFFALGGARNALVIAALENYSLTTVLFPAAVGLACLIVALFLFYRRRLLTADA